MYSYWKAGLSDRFWPLADKVCPIKVCFYPGLWIPIPGMRRPVEVPKLHDDMVPEVFVD